MGGYINQRGAALAVSLIVLLVMTIVVLSSTQNVVMQERMTSAVRDTHVSLSVAEAGLRDAEVFIESLTTTDDFETAGANVGDGGLFSKDNAPLNFVTDVDWSDASKRRLSSTIDGMQAQYVIAHLGTLYVSDEDLTGINMLGYGQTVGAGDVEVFQVVSRATGKSGSAERVVTAHFGKRF